MIHYLHDREEEKVDEKVKGLLQTLGDAINETLAASSRIEYIMDTLQDSGYEVCLVLEANPASGGKRPNDYEKGMTDGFTDDDMQFLRRLKIKC